MSYGSDRNGLIWAHRFAPGQAPQEIDSDAAALWLESTQAGADFVWLRESVGSTRLEEAGGALVAVIEQTSRTLFMLTVVTVAASMTALLAFLAYRTIGPRGIDDRQQWTNRPFQGKVPGCARSACWEPLRPDH